MFIFNSEDIINSQLKVILIKIRFILIRFCFQKSDEKDSYKKLIRLIVITKCRNLHKFKNYKEDR